VTKEQRKDPRVGLQGSAEIKFSSWAAFYETYMGNISRGGMMLQVASPPNVGDTMEIRL
jgi:hypothetical protein